jgi:transcription antitermination factor NusG
MNIASTAPRWFALQVRARWENYAAVQRSGKGYQVLLPTYRTKKHSNKRYKQLERALFPGYLFCEFDALNRLPILITPGVISVVSCGRVPAPVLDAEVAAIQMIVSSGIGAEPYPYLEVGNRVRLESGALQGLEGILIQFKRNHRLVVSVSLLRRSVAVEIDRSCVGASRPSANMTRDSFAL